MKIIFDKTLCNESDAETTVVVYSNVYVSRRVDTSESDNKCLMYDVNALDKNVDYFKKKLVFYGIL